ncbi:PREDICTED: GATA transcription factor 4-like [Ipomoea nil]|uniref:GATA transcription factor 4-like n=1 Tax=Ipomoea nil TaxID=35883 RepID=UPI000900C1BE|nr:PREDICTED: GATA transcription factor 4-like [Ipomoea nil]
MDIYGGVSAPELFRIDDLLDFSNADIFSSSAVDDSSNHHLLPHSAETTSSPADNYFFNPHSSADFTHDLCVPSEDAAELEWLSTFVEDSFSDIAANSTMNLTASSAAFQGRSRSKRSRSAATGWTAAMQPPPPPQETVTHEISNNKKRESSEDVPRRCTHCASEKTPQWRTGPLGPKTLCNACGVRFKSGRLVPEYRPAASPTFVLTQHSNSHRKVMELRRQKELFRQQQQQQQQQQQEMYGRHFQVC